ncbi:MAG: ribonuclease Z [Actinomycetia bacterium]|nr:ribonuclease Z [Actinomycetes bacterium]
MRLIFLGTGAGVPSRARGVASLALDLGGPVWLFDAGEGAQVQLMRTGLSARRIRRVFITHLHGDHLFGLPGLLSTRSFQTARDPLALYGPPGLDEFVTTALRLSGTHLDYPLDITEIADHQTLFHADGFTVSTRLLAHGVPSFGYRLAEDDRPGALRAERVADLGVTPGPWLAALKAGTSVTLPDGRTIDGRDLIGPARPGRTLAITGDTGPTPATIDLARGADVLVHESTYAGAEADLAARYGHSTCTDAARIAAQAGVGTLLLTHLSARYDEAATAALEAEARAIFPATHAMSDLATHRVPRRDVTPEAATSG